MQLIRSAEILESFKQACAKYEKHDMRYSKAESAEGIFIDDFIEFAYIVFMSLKQADEDSALKKAFRNWCEFHYSGINNLSVFFIYVDHLFSQSVTDIWIQKWDSKGRNIAKEHEIVCRIFILSGQTALQNFYKSGVIS